MPSYVSEPGVTIDRTATTTGIDSAAHFREDRQGFALRGEITAKPIVKGPLNGHVAIAITSTIGASTVYMTARQQIRARHVRKPYSIRFNEFPSPGSVIQVIHHDSANHAAGDI